MAAEVASSHCGRHRGDRRLYERCGMNVKTKHKYLHVARMWIHFCLVNGLFMLRWTYPVLDAAVWTMVAAHMHAYSGRPHGLSDISLESYMRMLSHILIYMAGKSAHYTLLHRQQHRLIQRVVDEHCRRYPESRSLRNTKSAWDDVLVDAGMRLLLQWHTYGHCHMHLFAWPAFCRMALAVLNYTGWRPFQLTRDRLDAKCPRWGGHPVFSLAECELLWQAGQLVAVTVACLRTKFRRNPRRELNRQGELVDRPLMTGKLTYCDAVDTCPVLAFLVWAIVCGAFGFAPLVRDANNRAVSSDPAATRLHVTCDVVDALVASIFQLCPSGCLPAYRDIAVFDGTLLGGTGQQVTTDRLSNAMHVVGVRLGLDPRRCSGISTRKTNATAHVCHPQTTPFDTARVLGHGDPRITLTHYADPRAANNDSTSILRRLPVRTLPGSVALAHSRNPNPDVAAARAAGTAAANAVVPMFGSGHALQGVEQRNAFVRGFRMDMQRQFDEQALQPRCGDTQQLQSSFFFTPYDCSSMSPAAFVSWQVKIALGLIPAGQPNVRA